jgi:hypothetical protein
MNKFKIKKYRNSITYTSNCIDDYNYKMLGNKRYVTRYINNSIFGIELKIRFKDE